MKFAKVKQHDGVQLLTKKGFFQMLCFGSNNLETNRNEAEQVFCKRKGQAMRMEQMLSLFEIKLCSANKKCYLDLIEIGTQIQKLPPSQPESLLSLIASHSDFYEILFQLRQSSNQTISLTAHRLLKVLKFSEDHLSHISNLPLQKIQIRSKDLYQQQKLAQSLYNLQIVSFLSSTRQQDLMDKERNNKMEWLLSFIQKRGVQTIISLILDEQVINTRQTSVTSHFQRISLYQLIIALCSTLRSLLPQSQPVQNEIILQTRLVSILCELLRCNPAGSVEHSEAVICCLQVWKTLNQVSSQGDLFFQLIHHSQEGSAQLDQNIRKILQCEYEDSTNFVKMMQTLVTLSQRDYFQLFEALVPELPLIEFEQSRCLVLRILSKLLKKLCTQEGLTQRQLEPLLLQVLQHFNCFQFQQPRKENNDSSLLEIIQLLDTFIKYTPQSAAYPVRMKILNLFWSQFLFPTKTNGLNSFVRLDDVKCFSPKIREAAYSLLLSLSEGYPSIFHKLLQMATSIVNQAVIPSSWDGISNQDIVRSPETPTINLEEDGDWGSVLTLLKSNNSFIKALFQHRYTQEPKQQTKKIIKSLQTEIARSYLSLKPPQVPHQLYELVDQFNYEQPIEFYMHLVKSITEQTDSSSAFIGSVRAVYVCSGCQYLFTQKSSFTRVVGGEISHNLYLKDCDKCFRKASIEKIEEYVQLPDYTLKLLQETDHDIEKFDLKDYFEQNTKQDKKSNLVEEIKQERHQQIVSEQSWMYNLIGIITEEENVNKCYLKETKNSRVEWKEYSHKEVRCCTQVNQLLEGLSPWKIKLLLYQREGVKEQNQIEGLIPSSLVSHFCAENYQTLVTEYFPHQIEFLQFIKQLTLKRSKNESENQNLSNKIQKQALFLSGVSIIRLLAKSKHLYLLSEITDCLIELLKNSSESAQTFAQQFLLDGKRNLPLSLYYLLYSPNEKVSILIKDILSVCINSVFQPTGRNCQNRCIAQLCKAISIVKRIKKPIPNLQHLFGLVEVVTQGNRKQCGVLVQTGYIELISEYIKLKKSPLPLEGLFLLLEQTMECFSFSKQQLKHLMSQDLIGFSCEHHPRLKRLLLRIKQRITLEQQKAHLTSLLDSAQNQSPGSLKMRLGFVDTINQFISQSAAKIKQMSRQGQAQNSEDYQHLVSSAKLVAETPVGEEFIRELYCPITKDLIVDPVIASDGNTYEREAIQQWLKRTNRSPLTNLPLQSKDLYPNLAMQKLLNQMK